MLESYAQSKKLIRYNLEVSKEQSYFVYFTLESLENVCFYSTTNYLPHTTHRTIEIHATPEFKSDLDAVLNLLSKKIPLTIETSIVND